MFTPTGRDGLLQRLVAQARTDSSVTAAALVGSAARRQTDRWSDIDLAFRLSPGTDPAAVADVWSSHLAHAVEVADHLDIWAGPALFRAHLLADSLQVHLSFWPSSEFAANGQPFELLFGEANPSRDPAEADPHMLVGWAWLYALHLRSALARRRHWQAVEMLEGLRRQLTALLCLRHGVPVSQGRGVDRLPADVLASLEATLVARPAGDLLRAALRAAIDLLLSEVGHTDPALALRLQAPLQMLCADLA